MPEPRITICPLCGWSFDLVAYPSCPNCRVDKQRGQADVRKRIEQRRSAAEAEERAKRSISFLYLVGLYLFGGVSYMVLMNHLMERPLFSVPVIEKTQVVPVPGPDRAAAPEKPQPVAKTVIDVRTTLADEVITVADWKRDEPAGGKIRYSGRVQNIGPASLTSVTMKLIGKDSGGEEVTSGFAKVIPYTLKPLEMGSFEIELPEDRRIASVGMRASWGQLFAEEIAAAGFEEKSSPEPPPGEDRGRASLVLRPESGGDPVVLTPDDVRRIVPGAGPPSTRAVAEFRKELEERKKRYRGDEAAGEDEPGGAITVEESSPAPPASPAASAASPASP